MFSDVRVGHPLPTLYQTDTDRPKLQLMPPDGFRLFLVFSSPTLTEISSLHATTGTRQFKMLPSSGHGPLMLLFKSDLTTGQPGINWSDVPYHAQLDVADLAGWMPPPPDTRMNLDIIIADRNNNHIVNQITRCRLNPHFSKHWYQSIAQQLTVNDFTEQQYDNTLDELYRRYTTRQLVNQARISSQHNS